MVDRGLFGVAAKLHVDGDDAVNRWFPTFAEITSYHTLLFVLAILIWNDTHFYFTHRVLHEVPFLYHQVHKIHHESYNPNTFSGLSFHPVEGMIYFSSVLFFFMYPGGYPIWAFHIHRFAMIIAPIIGHTGHTIVEYVPGGERPFPDPGTSFFLFRVSALPFYSQASISADHWIHHTKLYVYSRVPSFSKIRFLTLSFLLDAAITTTGPAYFQTDGYGIVC